MRELFSKKKKFYRNWFFSYFAFVILFLIFALVLTTTAKNIVKDEIMKTNEASFSTMETNIRVLKNDLDRMGVRISFDQQMMGLVENKIHGNRNWEYEQIRGQLDVAMGNYNYIDSAAIYLEEEDIMIEYDGVVGIQRLYQDYVPVEMLPQDADYAQWKMFMQKRHVQELYQSKSGGLLYLQTLPVTQKQGKAVLVCKVNRGKLFEMFPELSKDSNRLLLLKDGENLVFQTQEQRLQMQSQEKILALPAGSHVVREGGETWVVYVSAAQSSTTCILAISGKEFWHVLNLFMGIMIVVAALLGLLGIFLARLFARRQYTPVENIMEIMKKSVHTQEERSDEFEYIQSTLQTVLKGAKENEKEKVKYQTIFFRNEMIRLLREQGPIKMSSLLARFQLPFAFETYTVILLSINDISDYFGTIDFDNVQEQELMELAVTNVFEELLGSEFHLITLRLDENMIFCLIGTDGAATREKMLEKIKEAQRFTQNDVGIYYSALVSEPFQNIDEIKQAYLQTLDLYSCHHALEPDVLTYEQVDWQQEHYAFSVDVESRLIELIRQGMAEDARELLDQFFAGQVMQADISQKIFYMKYDLTSMFMKLIRIAKKEKDETFVGLTKEMASAATLEELHKITNALMEQFQSVFRQNKKEKQETALGENVMTYIKEHYADESLNVNSLGSAFELTPGYLSKVFKQQMGEILRDAILDVRLEHVEELLKTEMKLEDIAHACGFVDVGTLIRAFKKRYGVTPGKYRGTV